MKKPIYSVLCTLYSVLILCGCQMQKPCIESRIMMGTTVMVIAPNKWVATIAFEEMRRIENLLSKYKKNSEISKLNRLGKLKVSPDTFYILKKAKQFYELSDGAFDITVGPLLDLWGFTDKNYRVPSDSEVEKTLKLVGSDKIILQRKYNMVELMVSGMELDLGAIAKGYAVDCAIRKLKARGVKSCLINAGGEIYCLGKKSSKVNLWSGSKPNEPWKVAIKDPRYPGFRDFLVLENKAVATSGDYEQYFIKDKIRYTHIFNPKTGFPSQSRLMAATVIAPDCLTADFLSTAVFVLGKEKGPKLVEKFPGAEVRIFKRLKGKEDVEDFR